jgi:STE24 endopeptidase
MAATLRGTVAATDPPVAVTDAPAAIEVPAAARAIPLDPAAATRAYLDTVSGAARASSDSYFEGGYWLLLWDFLLGVGVSLGLLASGLSRKMRELAERLSRFRPIATFLYWAQYLVVTTVVLFPMAVYEGFFREHAYGLSNQSFGAWLGDQAKETAIGLVLGGIAAVTLYGVVRKLPRTWPVWGAVVAVLLNILGSLIAPVYIAPLFNAYTRLADPVVSGAVLRIAHAQGVPTEDVWVFDASRQTKRVSANVSGFASTMRISMNDNLLNRTSLAEIEAVLGHEIGHYVLNHVYKGILFLSVVVVIGFAFLRWAMEATLRRKGAAWGIRDVGDPAGLPLAALLLSIFFFVLTPAQNAFTRTAEAEADLFGLNASGQPDGFARAALRLGEYRKLDPGWLEEIIFYDHPSGRNRILMSMRWKTQYPETAEANARLAAEADGKRGWSPESAAAWAKEHEPR